MKRDLLLKAGHRPEGQDPEKGSAVQMLGRTGRRERTATLTIDDPVLNELRGTRAFKTLEKMALDPIIAGVLQLDKLLLRAADWSIEPGGEESLDLEFSEFVAENIARLRPGWQSTVGAAADMVLWGFQVFEVLFEQVDPGVFVWSGFMPLDPRTVSQWLTDPQTGQLQGLIQVGADGLPVPIPAWKLLHFRTEPTPGRPEGRALDSSTPIPTPNGWRVLDELQPGDKVFDEAGRIRYVTDRQDWPNRPCYELTFKDGTHIVADAAHEWLARSVHEQHKKYPPRLRTTEEIARSLNQPSGDRMAYTVDWHGPLDYPAQELPLDPYYLGLWLGDGSSYGADIFCHVADAEHVLATADAQGYTSRVELNGPAGGLGRRVRITGPDGPWDTSGPTYQLRHLGILRNKHIPAAYLRGSVEQRTAVLAGLMDSDGTVDAWGRCAFNNVNKRLIDGVLELIRSLGMSANLRLKRQAKDGWQDSWIVAFKPPWNPFRLSRKAERWQPRRRYQYHRIVGARPVAARRTVCITVDGPSHLFLAGRNMVPSHNSLARNAFLVWTDKQELRRIVKVGLRRDLTGMIKIEAPSKLFSEGASPEDKAALAEAENMAREVERDIREGLVVPHEQLEDGLPSGWRISLMGSTGRRQLDIEKLWTMLNRDMAIAMVGDSILIGHEGVGSLALKSSTTTIQARAAGSWLDVIEEHMEQYALPVLKALNPRFANAATPILKHGDIEELPIAELADYFSKLITAGGILPDAGLDEFLRRRVNAPESRGQEEL